MIWLLAVVEITAHSDCKTPKQRGGEAVEGKGEGGTHNCTVPHEGQIRLTLKQTVQNWKSCISGEQATNQTINTGSSG